MSVRSDKRIGIKKKEVLLSIFFGILRVMSCQIVGQTVHHRSTAAPFPLFGRDVEAISKEARYFVLNS